MTISSMLVLLFVIVSCSYNVFVAGGSYCLFLISLSVISSLLLLLTTNSFWYCCLLLLVYVGGVYVLLLFVSIYSYNSYSHSSIATAVVVSIGGLSLLCSGELVFNGLNLCSSSNFIVINDESLGILSGENWASYLFVLVVILLSIVILSFIFNDNSNYLR